MNIILGTHEAKKLDDKYIVLELDTITINTSDPIVAYCIVENLTLDKLTQAEPFKNLHANLIKEYRNRNWDFCLAALDQLTGFWGEDTDTFYHNLRERIEGYIENEPDESWTGIVAKNY